MGPAFNVLSLFSGGGGLDLGIHRAVRDARTVVYVEREAFACEVLAARMEEGALAPAPIWTDVCTFDGRPWRGVVDCVAGGSPCQDLSVAGKRAGLDGERSGLFFQFVRIVEEVRPGFVFWENVGGAASALPRVFDAFAALGYSGKAVKLRASDVGASHQRARVFLLGKLADAPRLGRREGWAGAGTEGQAGADGAGAFAGVADPESGRGLQSGRRSGTEGASAAEPPDARLDVGDADHGGEPQRRGAEPGVRRWAPDTSGSSMADSGDARREGRERAGAPCESEGSPRPAAERGRPEWPPGPGGDWSDVDPRFFPSQPRVHGVADGVAGGLVESVWADRLRMLGNGVVPAQAAAAWAFLEERVK